MIWGCLDGQQHLEASRRLLRVHEVHSQLSSVYAGEVAAKFPLLSHQWPLVAKFRCALCKPLCAWLCSSCSNAGMQLLLLLL